MRGTQEERLFWERSFDKAHNETVRYRDEEVRNRDTAIDDVWSTLKNGRARSLS